MICQLYKKCSGCQLQNMEYEEQLSFKQAKVVKLLGRFCHIDEIIGMENPLHYRNKVQMAFTPLRGKTVSGVYQSARRAVVPTDSCFLDNEKADEIIVTVRRLCEKFKIFPVDLRSGKGFLHHVLVRNAFFGKGIMVVLVTNKGEFRSCNAFINELLKAHPEITTIVRNINDSDKGLFLGEKSEILFGDGYITETLLGLDFRISPKSFFQVNPVQTEVLYKKAIEFANLSGKERLIDAYCGTGTIGLIMAKHSKEVFGVEINKDAVRDAKKNAEINNIENIRFFAADAGDFMDDLRKNGEKADVVITDPPRAGCSGKFLNSLISLSPKKVVYISCNPETLARDLYTLRKGGYKVKRIQPVDMFPYTDHVESVVLLERA
ncbi:MAG: 23S rRNA (uracil(1939)-C(5))-methyltransferase RlmD [Ruminococcaceae bacterium]|nr:23S rRNA (uracil(1939)-C(5))-methyltransferase RlmD [Oscillospiraceae bacterium]